MAEETIRLPRATREERRGSLGGDLSRSGNRSTAVGPDRPPRRVQARLNRRLRGVSFARITGVRDHLRRPSRLGTARRVRRLRDQHRQGHNNPSRRAARSGRPLGAVAAGHGIRAQADRIAPSGYPVPYVRGRECRATIARGIAREAVSGTVCTVGVVVGSSLCLAAPPGLVEGADGGPVVASEASPAPAW